MMNERGKSDRSIVPEKSSNNAAEAAAEGMEGRGRTKGDSPERNVSRTRSRTDDTHSALERVRQAARRDKALRFTALLPHIYDIDRLRKAYFALKRTPPVRESTERRGGTTGRSWRPIWPTSLAG